MTHHHSSFHLGSTCTQHYNCRSDYQQSCGSCGHKRGHPRHTHQCLQEDPRDAHVTNTLSLVTLQMCIILCRVDVNENNINIVAHTPSQLLPSLPRRKPSPQEHINDPTVLVQSCPQPSVCAVHSLTSANGRK